MASPVGVARLRSQTSMGSCNSSRDGTFFLIVMMKQECWEKLSLVATRALSDALLNSGRFKML